MSVHRNLQPLRRALITGASSGIGKASAIAFAKAGFDLALVARSQAKLADLAQSLSAFGVKVQAFPVDLAEIAALPKQMAKILEQFGPVGVLINSAGMGYTAPLSTMPLEDWQRLMSLNVTSVLAVIQAVLPLMRQQQQGMIINLASIAAQQAFPTWGAYGVSKAALVALSDAIAQEEAPHGIRVVSLLPGAVDTPLWDSETVQAEFDRSAMLRPETVAQVILQAALMPPEAVISHLRLTPSQGAL